MATLRDPILSKVLNFVHRGWPDKCPSEELRQYYLRKEELTIEDSILLWGLRVVVPQTLRFTMLNLLHDTHIGVVRMKGLARSRVWWPGIDADIERLCSQCVSCAQHSKDPAKSPLSVWDFPSGPWQRIHIDYAGPFYGSMWLIWIDAYSKYGGAEQVSSANGFNTVRKLREIFAMLGDFEQLVSDNGTHSLHENSANSVINTESGISDQHRITLQRTERPNASYKSSNVHFGRIQIKPRTVQFKPQ